LHGKKASDEAEKTAKETFQNKGVGLNLPEIVFKKKIIAEGLSLVDLIYTAKIMNSKSEVRRAIKNNGIKINDKPENDEKKILNLESFSKKNILKISYGKKKHYIIKIY
jgi:tyrosyl-tRNA synthetase